MEEIFQNAFISGTRYNDLCRVCGVKFYVYNFINTFWTKKLNMYILEFTYLLYIGHQYYFYYYYYVLLLTSSVKFEF